ncbi:restriction endonuclease, SacI family [Demequina litorisediminis]|uniref:Uncharacterized protein n=1 Tax=Demequina litorisediminis TaxID=1849022 RepID=A0ABQ6IJH9_9MICO|nr:restriction endonuclease, SacI family [Demequina litorisediminis]GMA37551.1 hypothetical protein GCM10025876_37550 [Demequina litorisediminis]
MMDISSEHDEGKRWQLDLAAAEIVMEQALAQRTADRANDNFVAGEWAEVSREVYGWAQAKTYLAAVLCGLVARATDARANPLSLQVGDDAGTFGYAATSLWQVIQGVAHGRVDLRSLKSQPFNNSPFGGKRILSSDWANVAPRNRPLLARTVSLMANVAEMSRSDAAQALRDFLSAVPDATLPSVLEAHLATSHLDLVAFFESLETFLLDDGENGRRAQAMVAAAISLVHPLGTFTPKSVNDPSRTTPGDVSVTGVTSLGRRRGLYVEAKQKYTPAEWVGQFAHELAERDPAGVGAYAALVNDRTERSARRASKASRMDGGHAGNRGSDDHLDQSFRHGARSADVVRA